MARRTSSAVECPAGCGRTFKSERGARQHVARAREHRTWTVDHDARWRPRDAAKRPPCGYTLRGVTCTKRGPHYCEPRADRVVLFFSTFLIHTKGPKGKARQRFVLASWQEHEIIRPLFGEVVWDDEHDCYVRRFRIAYIVVARKNGKSELAAGLLLYLLVGDDEPAAEVYGAAKDTKQAGKVFEPALRMAQLDPRLNGFSKGATGRIGHNKNARRLFDELTASYYEVITADALGELGHNPHGFCLDEVLSQRDGSLWEAMTTAVGARLQELLAAITTETNQPYSFGAELIDDAERVQEDPSRSPHVFAYVRKMPRSQDELDRIRRLYRGHPDLPVSLDPGDEANWKWANPALDDFKSRDSMRRQWSDSADNPAKRAAFCQFQLNQRRQQATRWVSLDLWDANIGEVAASPTWLDDRLSGACTAGLDLSSKFDMTAWCLLFDDGWVRWRFWVPETVVPKLSRDTGGLFEQWVEDGWVVATDGDVIDYERVYDDIETDVDQFLIRSVTYDKWCGEPVRQEIEKRTGVEMFESATTYERMTRPMVEFMKRLKGFELKTGGNPVARWMADNLEVKSPTDDPDRIRPVKPDRNKSGVRIDGMPALFFAIDGDMAPDEGESIYETRGIAL